MHNSKLGQIDPREVLDSSLPVNQILFTAKEVSKVLHIGVSTVRVLTAQGVLTPTLIGNSYRYNRSNILDVALGLRNSLRAPRGGWNTGIPRAVWIKGRAEVERFAQMTGGKK